MVHYRFVRRVVGGPDDGQLRRCSKGRNEKAILDSASSIGWF